MYFEMFFFKYLGHIFNVSSTFTTTGFAPASIIASTVAIKLNAWVITSSPLLTPKAFNAINVADVPLVTANANLVPIFFLLDPQIL